MNAVTHILDGGDPQPHDGHWSRNTALRLLGACFSKRSSAIELDKASARQR